MEKKMKKQAIMVSNSFAILSYLRTGREATSDYFIISSLSIKYEGLFWFDYVLHYQSVQPLFCSKRNL